MKSANRLALFSALCVGAVALLGCPPEKKPQDEEGLPEFCATEADCPDPNLFVCNQATQKCEPSCTRKEDCSADVRGEYALDYCASNLGCQCDDLRCVASLCGSDADCGSQVCRNGQCVAPPAASSVASCEITPDFVAVRAGSKVRFWVSTWDANKAPVVLTEGATWSSTHGAVTAAGTSGRTVEFDVAASGTVVGPVDAVQATAGSATCKAKVLVLPGSVPSGSLDVLLTDELTGRPISGATVVATTPTAPVTTHDTQTTDGNGYARLTVSSGKTTVTAFHAEYNYLTIANYDTGSASADARFLSMVVRRNQVAKYGGYKGTFQNVPQTSNVHAGIAGMSLPGSILDLSQTQLLGPSTPTDINLGSIEQKGLPIPAGVYLGFSQDVIKPTYAAQGLAGVCYDGAAPNESAISTGTCGVRSAWAMSGDVAISQLPLDAFGNGLSGIKFDEMLSKVLPLFKTFTSSVRRDVQFSLKTTTKLTNGEYDFNTSDYVTVDHDFKGVPLAFNFAVSAPDLPKFGGTYVDGVIVLGGALAPGRGVVPLGLGAGVNTNPADAKSDIQGELKSPGLIGLRMAPTHSGLEGTDYGVIALAVSLKSATNAALGVASSALFARVPNNRIAFDPGGAAPVSLGSSFLNMPENAKFNYTNSAVGAIGARSFRFTTNPGLTGSTMVRVAFTDTNDKRWVVLFDQAEGGFSLPAAPGGALPDRLFHTNNSNGERSDMVVQAIRINDNPSGGGSDVGFARLVELNSINADRLSDFLTGFSFVSYSRPKIRWVAPANAGEAVTGSVKVRVSSFKIGTNTADDGFVRLTFANGSGSCTPVDGNVETGAGTGEVSMSIPAGCTGQNVTLTATLFQNPPPGGGAATAVTPPVSSSIQANVQ